MDVFMDICDNCEEVAVVLYVCSECEQSFCEDCIIDHLLDEGLIEEKIL